MKPNGKMTDYVMKSSSCPKPVVCSAYKTCGSCLPTDTSPCLWFAKTGTCIDGTKMKPNGKMTDYIMKSSSCPKPVSCSAYKTCGACLPTDTSPCLWFAKTGTCIDGTKMKPNGKM